MDKNIDWSLQTNKNILIIGDSNLHRIPDHTQSQIQIESYPGAKFLHAANHLDKAKTDRGVTKVILSFGINNKDQKVKDS
ncbi:UNVERIFIED_CONTAM: hypothetical protein FKN15_022275 [Acipenser sinensis]